MATERTARPGTLIGTEVMIAYIDGAFIQALTHNPFRSTLHVAKPAAGKTHTIAVRVVVRLSRTRRTNTLVLKRQLRGC